MYLAAIGEYLKYGPDDGDDNTDQSRPLLPNYEGRRRFYELSLNREALETLMESCTIYFQKLSRDVLKDFSSTVLRNVTIKQNHSVKNKRIHNSDKKSSKDDSGIPNEGLPTQQYDIIPLPLILRFFEEWSHSFTMRADLFRCSNAASFSRIAKIFSNNDSMEKDRYDTGQQDNEAFLFLSRYLNYNDLRLQLFSSINRGNFFIGPEAYLRGPLLPWFGQLDIRLLLAFESECEPIIGREHYQELQSLFKRLVDYVGLDPAQTTTFERYITGLEIYISMMTTFSSYEAPPIDMDLWEERTMTERELSRLTASDRNNYRGKKFWAIKKKFRRPERSIGQKLRYSNEQSTKERWSQFVVYLMSTFLETEASTPWADDFARLYMEFKSKPKHDECLNDKFDTFLYSKISHIQEWVDCVRFRSTGSYEWCKTLRRIMLSSDLETSGSSWKNRTSKEFHRDLRTLVSWLWQKVSMGSKKRMSPKIVDPNQLLFPKEQTSVFVKILGFIFGGSHIHAELR